MLHTIKICTGCSCDKRFSKDVIKKAEKVFEIKVGETSKDGRIKLEKTGCMANCKNGPNVMFMNSSMLDIDGKVESNLLPHRAEKRFKELKKEWAEASSENNS